MSEPNQLELELIDPPQLVQRDLVGLANNLNQLAQQAMEHMVEGEERDLTVRHIKQVRQCLHLLEHKLPEVNKLISRRYELEQLLEKQNG